MVQHHTDSFAATGIYASLGSRGLWKKPKDLDSCWGTWPAIPHTHQPNKWGRRLQAQGVLLDKEHHLVTFSFIVLVILHCLQITSSANFYKVLVETHPGATTGWIVSPQLTSLHGLPSGLLELKGTLDRWGLGKVVPILGTHWRAVQTSKCQASGLIRL